MRRFAFVLLLAACGNKSSAPTTAAVNDDAPPPSDGTDACASLDEAGCRANAACAVIHGQQEVVDHPCVLDDAFYGCMPADTGCDDAITYARDGDNQVYWFMDTCIPEGWTSEPYPAGRSEPPPSCN